jgi:hypothetical protein
VRSLLLSPLLLLARVGCLEPAGDPDDKGDFCPLRKGDYGRYDDMHVKLSSQGTLTLSIQGSKRHGHCPPAFFGTARVNGIAMRQTESGGAECISGDSDKEYCLPLAYVFDGKLLPTGGKTLDIAFDPVSAPDKPDYAPARAWHMTVDWTSERVWLEDDLAARVHANEEFEVHWTPEDAPAPRLELSVLAQGSWEGKGLGADRLSSEPGVARYRFRGPEPAQVWSLKTTRELANSQVRCEGFERCSVEGSHDYELSPAGISPASPDGVAPPRACIALPGEDGSLRYAAPYWVKFPDLSMLPLSSHMSCDGGDLYFVVLGACGVCGGGKSTYVVGNRGTRAASFSVRSNVETSDGAMLEPQQLSEPFEISFDGELSALEIVSDDDCAPESNKAWVASIACDWPVWPPTPDWEPDGCNNTCGFPSGSAP